MVNYVTFDVYDKLGRQQETEKRNLAYEQQIALCNKQAAERETAYQETRRVRHDLNGYLVDLKAAIQSGELKEAEKRLIPYWRTTRFTGMKFPAAGTLS